MHDVTTFVLLITVLFSLYIVIAGINKLNDQNYSKHKKKYTKVVVIVFAIILFLVFTGVFKLGGNQKEYFPTVQSFDSERSTNTSYNRSIDQRYQNKNHEKADNRLNQLIKDLDENN